MKSMVQTFFIDNNGANFRLLPFENDSPSSIVNNDVVVYPNPATNILNVESSQELSGTLVIYNSLGKPVKSHTATGTKITLPTEDLPSGLYILKINDNKIRFSVVK